MNNLMVNATIRPIQPKKGGLQMASLLKLREMNDQIAAENVWRKPTQSQQKGRKQSTGVGLPPLIYPLFWRDTSYWEKGQAKKDGTHTVQISP